ncbi:MAG: lysophospholipid acyltransferase family protein [Gammaproteobacteria bacterium]|jgi:1-acyl-sn-glycerol-3-phosphate acyltransferase
MMLTLRSSVYFIIMVFLTVFFGLIMAIFGWFLPFEVNSKIATSWADTNLFCLKWLCGLDYEVNGLENIPDSACIIMSKHQSAWETIAFRTIFPSNQAWVLKKELMFVPVFGWALAVVSPIAIDRKAAKKAARQVIDQGLEKLSLNRNIMIFPEGTRVAPGEHKRYGIGGGLLAEKANVPVIPVAHNAGVFWKRRGLIKLPGKIQVVVGEPIDTAGKRSVEIMKEVEDYIEGKMLEIPSHP